MQWCMRSTASTSLSHLWVVTPASSAFTRGRWRSTPGGQIPTHCRTYIDGALLMQRNASALFTAWSEEMFLPTSSDRDQIAFAFVVGSTCASVGTIGPKGQQLLGDGRSYRHWYRDGSIALLNRTDFERKLP